ncbi:hypothetical protein CHCC20327_0903 [Bacillus licheniformis]|nr:hypothetical protein CHCC20327_0903 [Bacillus licheniformis]
MIILNLKKKEKLLNEFMCRDENPAFFYNPFHFDESFPIR